jgi:hypothetical protein
MPKARIYQPDKNAMQSGKGKTKQWLLEFAPAKPQPVDSLMGWTGMSDTERQLQMPFDSKEAAIAFATKQGLEFEVFEPNVRVQKPKAYAENFAFGRIKA